MSTDEREFGARSYVDRPRRDEPRHRSGCLWRRRETPSASGEGHVEDSNGALHLWLVIRPAIAHVALRNRVHGVDPPVASPRRRSP